MLYSCIVEILKTKIMSKFKFKKREVFVNNLSNHVTDYQCTKFISKYISHLLAEEVLPDGLTYFPDKGIDRYTFYIFDEDETILIRVNEENHMYFKLNEFHDVQVLTEIRSSIHRSFFKSMRAIKVKGIELMSF